MPLSRGLPGPLDTLSSKWVFEPIAEGPPKGEDHRHDYTAETQAVVHEQSNGRMPAQSAPPQRDHHPRSRAGSTGGAREPPASELKGGMADRLREARASAPPRNDDYLQIQEEEIILAVRAARLDELLERAQVIDVGSLDGRAAVGTIG